MKLCTIGCGEHAVSSHGPAQARYFSEHGGLELAGCCDLEPARAEAFRQRFGYARSYTDAHTMLEAERPDAVALIVPDTLTAELASGVLARGIPLLLEKPPGRTVEDVDRMVAAAAAGGRGGQAVPHQVAFNRRFVWLIDQLRQRLTALTDVDGLQHIRYEMVRVNRRDPDFSTTAIHGIDAVRFITGSDFAEVRFRRQELPAFGPGVANIFADAVLACGATAHLSFCPMAGVVIERIEAHAHDHTFLVEVPMWGAFDAPGRLQHLERGGLREEVRGEESEPFVQGGFYREYVAFFESLRSGRRPAPDLRASRQSVEVAEAMRARKEVYRP